MDGWIDGKYRPYAVSIRMKTDMGITVQCAY